MSDSPEYGKVYVRKGSDQPVVVIGFASAVQTDEQCVVFIPLGVDRARVARVDWWLRQDYEEVKTPWTVSAPSKKGKKK